MKYTVYFETMKKVTSSFFSDNIQLADIMIAINKVADKHGINQTPQRLAAFIAQMAHESGQFLYKEENLNYSAQGLMNVFGKYFPNSVIAESLARKPNQIASRVYANRMGNGTEESGDGYKFRGRGYIQLTGKSNYTQFATDHDLTSDQAVEYLSTIEGAVESAAWYWSKNKLNRFCDSGDFIGLTRAINGGTNGLDHRQQLYKLALDSIIKLNTSNDGTNLENT